MGALDVMASSAWRGELMRMPDDVAAMLALKRRSWGQADRASSAPARHSADATRHGCRAAAATAFEPRPPAASYTTSRDVTEAFAYAAFAILLRRRLAR